MTASRLTPDEETRIRERAEAARVGPWAWFGNRSGPIYLATVQHGRRFVLTFEVTEEKGESGAEGDVFRWAQPCFQVYDDKEGEAWTWSGRMTPASELAVVPQTYRDDISGIDNADAEFIAHARTDIPALLSELFLVRGQLREAEEALTQIGAQQQETLAMIESNGFVFDDIGAEPGNWQHLAFSIYTDLCRVDTVAHQALDDGVFAAARAASGGEPT